MKVSDVIKDPELSQRYGLGPLAKRPRSFRAVVENASDVGTKGLAGTMSGDAVAPATQQEADQNAIPDADLDTAAAEPDADVDDNPDAEAHGAIEDTYKRLNDMLGATPGVNFEEKYRELLK